MLLIYGSMIVFHLKCCFILIFNLYHRCV